MSKFRTMTTVAISALLLGLGGCNMYVIDFENKLPDGSVLAPKADNPPEPPKPLEPVEGSQDVELDFALLCSLGESSNFFSLTEIHF